MSQTVRPTPVVLTLIALNTAMFLIEVALGGSTNELTLHRLGALEPAAVIFRAEYWRLLTALFLHYGALHLFVNLYALYVLGPPLENSIGATRFAACYLISGIGSSAGVVVLRFLAVTSSDQLVGASGAVMGVVGAWAGLLLRHRHLPSASHRLRSIVIIVVMQTAFDLWTPQVSMTAHLSGLVTGLIAGFLLAPQRAAT
jgi:membrane associated rhomboid family serine protease